MDVALTPAGQSDPLYAGAAAHADYFQWHSCGVLRVPEGGVSLARSPACEIQAMRVGESAYGIQYHVELTPATVTDWAAVPAYAEALDSALGEGALQRLDADARRACPSSTARRAASTTGSWRSRALEGPPVALTLERFRSIKSRESHPVRRRS